MPSPSSPIALVCCEIASLITEYPLRSITSSPCFSLPHTGNLLRAEIQAETELGLIAREQIEKGELLPDELMVKREGERRGKKGGRSGRGASSEVVRGMWGLPKSSMLRVTAPSRLSVPCLPPPSDRPGQETRVS